MQQTLGQCTTTQPECNAYSVASLWLRTAECKGISSLSFSPRNMLGSLTMSSITVYGLEKNHKNFQIVSTFRAHPDTVTWYCRSGYTHFSYSLFSCLCIKKSYSTWNVQCWTLKVILRLIWISSWERSRAAVKPRHPCKTCFGIV